MNDDTHLLRQVNPSWIQQGRVTSQLFKPTPKDKGQVSVYDGEQITPEAAWQHYTNASRLKSVGVKAVTVNECEEHELCVVPDPKAFPEHVLIDFGELSKNQMEKKAKKLTRLAVERGWLYQGQG